MKFTAPDGTQFDSKIQYRDYMMVTFYSFKGKRNKHNLIKHPNDIDGQPFDIADCEECSIAVMDVTEQIQVDGLNNCRVFVGACSSTIFVRNCTNCVFYTCCRQLRLREVNSCIFFSFSENETHIEFSSDLMFAPFVGGYPEQQEQFNKINLKADANVWFSVYDHNDPDKTGKNWSLMDIETVEQEEPWFPSGVPSEPFIDFIPAPDVPATGSQKDSTQVGQTFGIDQMIADSKKLQEQHIKITPGIATTGSNGKTHSSSSSGQVGESFSLEQMIADAEQMKLKESEQQQKGRKSPPRASKQPSPHSGPSHHHGMSRLDAATEKLKMETALLIASACGKGIDVAIWIGGEANNNNRTGGKSGTGIGIVEVSSGDFGNKLSSLASMVGLNEDWETKKELDLATELSALRAATAACLSRKDPDGTLWIDVALFIQACKDKVELYLEELEIDKMPQGSSSSLSNKKKSNTGGGSGSGVRQQAYAHSPVASVSSSSNYSHNSIGPSPAAQIDSPSNIYVPYGKKSDDYKAMFKESSTDSQQDENDDDDDDNEYEEYAGGEEVEEEEQEEVEQQQQQQQGQGRRPSGRMHRYNPDEDTAEVLRSMSTEEYIEDLKSKGGAYRPQSAPAGKHQNAQSMRDSPEQKTSSSSSRSSNNRPHTSKSTSGGATSGLVLDADYDLPGGSSGALPPSSPYDEQVEFDDDDDAEEEEEDDDEGDATAYANSRRPVTHASRDGDFDDEFGRLVSPQHPSNKRNGNATRISQQRAFGGTFNSGDDRYNNNNINSDRSELIDYNRKTTSAVGNETSTAAAVSVAARFGGGADPRVTHEHIAVSSNKDKRGGLQPPSKDMRTSQSIERRRTSSGYGQQRAKTPITKRSSGIGASSTGRTSVSNQEQLEKMKELVEDLIRNTVKKADLYHNIQVGLGFIQPYTLVPPRGCIVSSQPREWLTIRELQTAFMTSRLCLSEAQVLSLQSLVVSFAKVYEELYPSKPAPPPASGQWQRKSVASGSAGAPGTAMPPAPPSAAEEKDKIDEEERSKNEHTNTTVSMAMSAAALAAQWDSAVRRPTSKTVLGANRTLSADWLKRYIVHLRLTKKSLPGSSASSSSALAGRGGGVSGGTEKVSDDINSENRQSTSIHISNSGSPSRPRSAPPRSSFRVSSSGAGADECVSSSDAPVAAAADHERQQQQQQQMMRRDTPKQWQEWLGEKLLHGIAKGAAKPKEFEKALEGNKCHLSKDDINTILGSRNRKTGAAVGAGRILSDEALNEEVCCRVESWLIDMSGRRDFQHVINLRVRMWAKDQKRLDPSHPSWQRMSASAQTKVTTELTEQLEAEKREELLSAERTSGAISKDLFWKFDASRKEDDYQTTCTWSEWLQKHLRKVREDIERFKETVDEHTKAVAVQHASRRTVAGLAYIESFLEIVAQSLNRDTQIELQKAITAMRRTARSRGLANGSVVTKDDFDAHIKPVLAPHLKNGGAFDNPIVIKDELGTAGDAASADTATGSSSPARASSSRRSKPQEVMLDWTTRNEKLGEQFHSFFHSSLETAVQQVIDFEEAQSKKHKSNFEEWEAKKKDALKLKKEKEMREKERAEKEKVDREKKAAKAYAKWTKLRKANKYKSKVDKKTHPIPKVHAPEHEKRWYVEKDLQQVYAEKEKRF